ncbi:MAG TPA: undecaprenyldiphospho-muramoylpentapeptide beta-N-acetylglucosaminyltransferase [Actinomycetota bacterium]|nr:undecaprenyldiphospho-muramoylpentapeptide beta-N-acetylglucosaminyltransferase [Actinomycetota bacterium]
MTEAQVASARPPSRIVIGAGGTGGHIFPGLALAGAIEEAEPGARVDFVGTERGLEKTLIPNAGYPLHMIDVLPLQRKIGLEPLLAGGALVKATWQARRLLRALGADVAVGMGGYPSLPVIVAATSMRLPCLLHESGAVAGLANKIAGRLTPNVALSFDEAASAFKRPTRTTGMPLSPAIARMDRSALRPEARAAYALADDRVAVLVMGGSLGALRLNELALGLAERWKGRDDVRIVLKAGRGHLESTQKRLAELGAEHVVDAMEFLDRMELAYAAADVAITRAGAGTVAELPAAGLPAVLIPYPHAPGDHQTLNAQPLVDAGAAYVVADREATPDRVGPLLEQLIADRGRLAEMGEKAKRLAKPNAADDLAAWVLDLARQRKKR